MLLTNLDMQTAIVIDNYEARSGILTNLNIWELTITEIYNGLLNNKSVSVLSNLHRLDVSDTNWVILANQESDVMSTVQLEAGKVMTCCWLRLGASDMFLLSLDIWVKLWYSWAQDTFQAAQISKNKQTQTLHSRLEWTKGSRCTKIYLCVMLNLDRVDTMWVI